MKIIILIKIIKRIIITIIIIIIHIVIANNYRIQNSNYKQLVK